MYLSTGKEKRGLCNFCLLAWFSKTLSSLLYSKKPLSAEHSQITGEECQFLYTCSQYLNNDIKNRDTLKEVLTKPDKQRLLQAYRSFLWMPHRKFLLGKKNKPKQPKQRKKSCIKGKRSSARVCMLPVRHSRKCDFSVYLCSKGEHSCPPAAQKGLHRGKGSLET